MITKIPLAAPITRIPLTYAAVPPVPDAAARARYADLVILPADIPGTSCFSCQYLRPAGCTHPAVLQPVQPHWCCFFWDRQGTVRVADLMSGAVHYAAAHAPAGGVTVQGKRFTGGQFIPAEVMAHASPEEREAVESGEARGKPLPPAGGAKLKGPPKPKEWRPTMPAAAAKAWAADSAWKDPLYHVTQKHNVEAIKQGGFRVAPGAFGAGVYFSLDGNPKAATGSAAVDAAPVKARVDVRNPLNLDFTSPTGDWEKDPNFQIWESLKGGDGEAGRQRLLEAGYDAVSIKFGTTEYRLVLDPQSIVIEDDAKPAESPPAAPETPRERNPIEQITAALPETARARLQTRVTEFRPHGTVAAVTDAWYAAEPNPPPANKRTPCLGFYDPETGVLHYSADGVVDARGVLAHEIFHGLDQDDTRKFFDLSGHPEFLHAWRTELKGGALSKYAGFDEVEGFAELGRAIYGTDGGAAAVAERFPVCFAYLKKVGLVAEPARYARDAVGTLLIYEDGHWVQMGAQPGADGEKHGGTPILLKDGVIEKGPGKFVGKHPGEIGKRAQTPAGEVKPPRDKEELKAAVRKYQTGGFMNLNTALWGDAPLDAESEQLAAGLDAAASPVSKDTFLYRGILTANAGFFADAKPGDRIILKGYTSLGPKEIADDYSGHGRNPHAMAVRIDVPKGVELIGGVVSALKGEQILPRGATIEFVGRDQDGVPTARVVPAVQEPQPSPRIVTNLKDMIEVQADNFAKLHPWSNEFTREGFVKNWKKAYRKLEADPAAAKEITDVVNAAFAKYGLPPVPIFVRKQTADEKMGGENAHWDNGFMVISDDVLGERAYHSVKKPLESERKYTVKEAYDDPIQGLVVHEMGHRFHEDESPHTLVTARGILSDPAERKEVERRISGYAATRPQELVAEAYTMSKHPDYGSLPSETQGLIERILGRG